MEKNHRIPQKRNGKALATNTTEKKSTHSSNKMRFLPILTVDDLILHRKKKSSAALPSDNLFIQSGSFKQLKSEYMRCFKNFIRSLPKAEEIYTSFEPEGQHNILTQQNKQSSELVRRSDNSEVINLSGIEPICFKSEKRRMKRKLTTLMLEGDFYHTTNYAENFVPYITQKREELQRKKTLLKLEGEMEHRTENRESFVPYDNVQRPSLCKKMTNLHLEGSYDMLSEHREKFLPMVIVKQPIFSKKPTNLHLEGDIIYIPEYRSQFTEYKIYERPKPVLPANHIQVGKTSNLSIDEEEPLGTQKHPLIPFLRNIEQQDSSSNIRRRDDLSPYKEQLSLHYQSRSPTIQSSESKYLKSPSSPTIKSSESRFPKSPSRSRYRNEVDVEPNRALQQPSNMHRREKPVAGVEEVTQSPTKNQRSPSLTVSWDPSIPSGLSSSFEDNLPKRFECQPEYRKALQNYRIREKIEKRILQNADQKEETTETSLVEESTKQKMEEKTTHRRKSSTVKKKFYSNLYPGLDSSKTEILPFMSDQHYFVKGRPPKYPQINLNQIEKVAFGPKCVKWKKYDTGSSFEGQEEFHDDISPCSDSDAAFVVVPSKNR